MVLSPTPTISIQKDIKIVKQNLAICNANILISL